jgi:hypothetical protein
MLLQLLHVVAAVACVGGVRADEIYFTNMSGIGGHHSVK